MTHRPYRPNQSIIAGKYAAHHRKVMWAREGDDDKTPVLDETGVNNIVHKAITKRLTDPAFLETISTVAASAASTAITEASAGIAEQVAATLAATQAPVPDPAGDTPPPQVSWKDSPEYKDMQKRDKDREAERDAEKAERKAEKDAQLRVDERTALEAELRAGGIEEIKIRGCVATLIHEDKVMQRGPNNEIVYRINRGDYNDDMDVAKGVATFLATDEGKTYLPATGSRGTGATGDSTNNVNNSSPHGTKQTKEEAARILSDNLFAGV